MGGEVAFPGSVANLAEKYAGVAGHSLWLHGGSSLAAGGKAAK